MAKLLHVSNIRALVKEHGRQLGRDFIYLLEAHIERKVREACGVKNGGKKTIDASVAGFVGVRG